MLFHVTIRHDAKDCPGRNPNDPPVLVAPSDTRADLGQELGVKLHFVLWGAACMLWAQPEHLAYAVLEAEDIESALQYVGALVPSGWNCDALPVWNLPSQLRLIRQVRLAPPMQFGEALAPAETASSPQIGSGSARSVAEKLDEAPAQSRPEPSRPGTITRLLRDLEIPTGNPEEIKPGTTIRHSGPDPDPDREKTPASSTQIVEQPRATTRVRLVATAGPTKGKTYSVGVEGATIGRLAENGVYIPDDRLSREHARIEYRDGQFWLSDLASRNGTALNGSLLRDQQVVQSGDTVELGLNTLVVTIEGQAQGSVA